MANNNKEKFIDIKIKKYDGKCPICKEKGETTVLPFGEDSFFCENPNCDVIRHSRDGYYVITTDDIHLENVDEIPPSLFLKRKS